ncbi:MAG: glycosyltransferase domain-containing protein [Paracoccaceae bacterium]
MPAKIAVYTCVIGDYDPIPVERPDIDGVDFFVFSNIDLSGRTDWTSIRFAMPEYSATLQNRFVKMHPSLMLPEYDFLVYVDGNVQIVGDVSTLVSEMAMDPEFVIGLYQHPFRGCIYSEGAACIKHSRDWFWKIAKQLRRYASLNYPLDNGLYEAGVIVSRRSEKTDLFFRAWWLAYLSGSARDQLSLPFAAWKLSIPIRNLGRSDFRYIHRFFKLVPHKSAQRSSGSVLARAVNSLVYRAVPAGFLFGLKDWRPELGEPDRVQSK